MNNKELLELKKILDKQINNLDLLAKDLSDYMMKYHNPKNYKSLGSFDIHYNTLIDFLNQNKKYQNIGFELFNFLKNEKDLVFVYSHFNLGHFIHQDIEEFKEKYLLINLENSFGQAGKAVLDLNGNFNFLNSNLLFKDKNNQYNDIQKGIFVSTKNVFDSISDIYHLFYN